MIIPLSYQDDFTKSFLSTVFGAGGGRVRGGYPGDGPWRGDHRDDQGDCKKYW